MLSKKRVDDVHPCLAKWIRQGPPKIQAMACWMDSVVSTSVVLGIPHGIELVPLTALLPLHLLTRGFALHTRRAALLI